MATAQWGATFEDNDKKVLAFASTLQSVTLTRSLNAPAEVEGTLALEGADTKALFDQIATEAVYLRLAANGTTRFFGVLTDLQASLADDATVSVRFGDLAVQYATVYPFNQNGSVYLAPTYVASHNSIVDSALGASGVRLPLTRSGSVTSTRTFAADGMASLDILSQLAELQNGIEWYVDPTGTTADQTFLMAGELGSDKSATVRFQYGAGRATVPSATVQYLPPRNRVWTSKENSIYSRTLTDSTSITNFGAYHTIVQELETGAATESDVADQRLRTSWRRIVELSLEPSVCPRPWTDFNLGDKVGIDLTTTGLSLSTAQRINQITISLDDQLVESEITIGSEVI